MSIKLGNITIAGLSESKACNTNQLLESRWFDHILNSMEWLRADTFSWQSGSVYTSSYNHLTSDIAGKSLSSETVEGITIQYYLADDGHKITPASQVNNVLDLYNKTGIAWYFILDADNTQFKLPRINPDRELLLRTDVAIKGNGMALGLTNGTYNGGLVFATPGSQPATSPNISAYGANVGETYNYGNSGTGTSWGVTTDETKSGIEGVVSQLPYSGKKYLYFFVGNFTQTALEQTAGITSEQLNNKVDISSLSERTVIIDSYINGNSWYRVYSDGWCEQGGFIPHSAVTGAYTLNFLKEFADTNYYFQRGTDFSDYNAGYASYFTGSYGSKTTSSIAIYMIDNNIYTGCYWQAKGYITQENTNESV